jgi:hypothetical protein
MTTATGKRAHVKRAKRQREGIPFDLNYRDLLRITIERTHNPEAVARSCLRALVENIPELKSLQILFTEDLPSRPHLRLVRGPVASVGDTAGDADHSAA